MVRVGALDKMMAWNKFAYNVIGYYLALTARIGELAKDPLSTLREKEGDNTLYEEFEWLYQEFTKIFREKHVPVDSPEWRKMRIQRFFRWEGTLLEQAKEAKNNLNDSEPAISIARVK